MADHNDLGEHGEELACEFLTRKGYKIIEKNWRVSHLELDIIAEKDDWLVVVEVKTLRGNYFQNPEDQVSWKKIRNLVNAANSYIIKNNITKDVRFDVVAVLIKWNGQSEIEHIEDAFLPPVM